MKNERQKELLEILKREGYTSTSKLAKLLYTSLPTIRRDLIFLEQAGYVVRSHGGVALPSPAALTPADFRRSSHWTEKQQLCSVAQNYLKDYQTIFLDESTTVLPLVKYLPTLKNAVVITNGVDALAELRNAPVELYCTGGKCLSRNNLIGRFAEDFISNFNIDVCFFSSTGITADGQIVDVDEAKMGIVRALLKYARKKIYLCDVSKLDVLAKFNVANADAIDLIITNAPEGSFSLPEDKVLYCL